MNFVLVMLNATDEKTGFARGFGPDWLVAPSCALLPVRLLQPGACPTRRENHVEYFLDK